MPIVKCNTYIAAYEAKATCSDPNELTGRTGRSDLTTFISKSIVSHLATSPKDTIVDIGCGDGTLLKLLKGGGLKAIGLLPTDAEVERVRSLTRDIPNCEIRQGLAQSTGLPSTIADQVICNGVIILLTAKEVEDALREIARIAKPSSRVFIGEVPYLNEQAGKTYGDSICLWLWYVFRNQGVYQFVTRLQQVVVAVFSREAFVIAPKTHFWCDPDDFVDMAREYGLIERARFRHREISIAGDECDSRTRWDYIFEKTDGHREGLGVR